MSLESLWSELLALELSMLQIVSISIVTGIVLFVIDPPR